MSECPGHGRHWFTRYGSPGERTDRCVRCGKPKGGKPTPAPKVCPHCGGPLRRPMQVAATNRLVCDACRKQVHPDPATEAPADAD